MRQAKFRMIAALPLLAACGGSARSRPDASLPGDGAVQPTDAASGPRDGAARDASSARDGALPRSDAAAGSNDAGSPRSAGCGAPATGTSSFVTSTLHVGDLDRTVHLHVPTSYDPERAYPLVFRWHGSGGDGLSGGLGIEYSAGEDALIVSADGLDRTWVPSSRERDVALFDALYAMVTEHYCVDRGRVFSYGFSAGGSFTNELACVRADLLRGSAAIASGPSKATCASATAAWFLHDANDDVVFLSLGQAARDHALQQNGCGTRSVDIGSGCFRYEGCAAGEPVVWCQTSGRGHDIRGDFAPPLVWQFFSSLP